MVPDEGYLAKVHALCKKHNVLLICDEIQTVGVALKTCIWASPESALLTYISIRVFAGRARCCAASTIMLGRILSS